MKPKKGDENGQPANEPGNDNNDLKATSIRGLKHWYRVMKWNNGLVFGKEPATRFLVQTRKIELACMDRRDM